MNSTRTATRRRTLHPTLVHVPIGSVVIAAVLDTISFAKGGDVAWSRDLYRAGGFALMVGTAVLFLAVLAGFVDRARVVTAGSSSRSAVNRHAAVMGLVGAMCVVEIVVRRQGYADAHSTPGAVLVLSVLLLAVMTVGGEMGGRLVHRRGIGVWAAAPHTAGERPHAVEPR